MAIESSVTDGEKLLAPTRATPPVEPRGGRGLSLRLLFLAVMVVAIALLLNADMSDSREIWLGLMGVLWLGVLAVKGSGRV